MKKNSLQGFKLAYEYNETYPEIHKFLRGIIKSRKGRKASK